MRHSAGVSLEAVSKSYATPGGMVHGLEHVTLEIAPGTSCAVTGPSGCGKSTLLALIAGLEQPSTGRVVVGGRVISGLSRGERARLRRHELGLVFQADNLLPFLTARENVALGLAMQPVRADDARCSALLEHLGLADEADKLPDQLSGGQRQRVALARALVHRPRLVLADEPTGSLDGESSELVIELLLAAQRETPTTLVVVTHDATLAQQLDSVVRLSDGRLDGVGLVAPSPSAGGAVRV